MQLSKIWTVARHEFLTNIRRPGFIIMTAIVPALALIGLLIGAFGGEFFRGVGRSLESFFEGGSRKIGIVDGTGLFTPLLPEYEESFTLLKEEEEARKALKRDELDAVLVIPPDYIETGTVKLITKGSSFEAAIVEDSRRFRSFFIFHLLRGKVEPEISRRVSDPLKVQPEILSNGGKAQGSGPWSFVFIFIVPYFLSLMLIMTIFVSSGYLLQSIAEEKENRVMEIIVSSVSPMELLLGKVIGLGAVGLTQVMVWILTVLGFTTGSVLLLAVSAFSLPVSTLALVVLYYILGFSLYAFLMAGTGSLGATMRESNQLAGVFALFAAAPYILSGFLIANPNLTIARILSFFPLTAPTMMLFRLPLAQVPWIDIAGSLVVLVLSLFIAIWLGEKLFRVGILMYGKRPSVKEIWLIILGR
ncbi:MAG: ABC transporter permease [Anaerolineae bacterium]|nr:ABC transporter permease [Anaerolineae bacterium]MDW8103054.1 ABC transporter permease [Anaerolineae bacterium]